MRNGWAIMETTDEVLKLSAQLGVNDIVVYGGPSADRVPGTGQPLSKPRAEYEDYLALRKRLEAFGLRITAIEGGFVRDPRYEQVAFGGPDRDRQIELLMAEIRDMARAGIPVYGYNWMPNSWLRTTPVRIRAGAETTAFDYEEMKDRPFSHGREYSDEEMWEHLEYWIKAITPVAEEEGIRLGIHPDDPPVPRLYGIPRLLRSHAAYRRLLDFYPSDHNAIEFCQGTFSEMEDDVYEALSYFGSRNKILYVHFRNISGRVPKFNEEFLNTGYVDMHRAMKTLHEVGYDGVIIDDHCPILDNDPDFPGNLGGYRTRTFAQGYIQAMIEAVKKEAAQA